MKKIIYTKPDGGLAVVHPVRNTHPQPEKLSDEEIVKRAMKDVPSNATDVKIVEEDVIPKDRTFRDAWRFCPQNGCRVDMPAAKEIHRQMLRDLRTPILNKLDVEFMRALELGQPTDSIVAKKQTLRDVTKDPAIDSARTPDELTVPAVLR